MTTRYLMLEARRAYRNKRFLVFTVGMPVVLFLIYVQMYGKGAIHGVDVRAYLMVSMAAFGAMSGAMSAGTRIALERQSGWNRQLRLTPLKPVSYLVAKAAVAMVVAVPSVILVYGAGALVAHVRLSPQEWVVSAAGLWLALIPFAVIGVVIGYVASPDSAQAIFPAIFMTLSLFGGIFIPVEAMPKLMANLAQLLPSYWLGIIGRSPLGLGGFEWKAVPVLLAWTVVLTLIVVRRYRVDTART
ncbi:ABC-2 type transport system permease protein [Actinopolymorpha cephalotaxi]|uniref:Transport permease protein n=1 Tax=Actinopolymorpha cephalotaxi TaxID=504797 RepID=A0A1I2QU61_9ACTN|nr:ABC transporter permease [Actinopolymorpha cephalotaxi]NYH82495.1 ABC-2 type transport system permease protein [Actinopolymorpha cephalotaxi]SFG31570.1 ABC-2 type transport system permease protein [Actinopolymorpha cephalotaxi]